jgi:hypothetical protein
MMDDLLRPELLSQPIAQKISVSLETAQPFSYSYAKGTYQFSTAYSGTAGLEHISFQVRVGICQARVFGKSRGKIIILLDGDPGTEFTETDAPGFYASVLRSARRLLRPGEPLPAAFGAFVVATMRDLIEGPHVRYAQAVVVPAEELATMVRYAFIKRLLKEKGARPAKMTEPQYNYSSVAEEQFKSRALETGMIREIKRTEYQPGGDRAPITVKGKPLSQEVIEDRR